MALVTELGRGGSRKAKAEMGKAETEAGSRRAGRPVLEQFAGKETCDTIDLEVCATVCRPAGVKKPALRFSRSGNACKGQRGRTGSGVAPRRGTLWGCSFPWAEVARLPSDSRSATGKAGDEPSPPRPHLRKAARDWENMPAWRARPPDGAPGRQGRTWAGAFR
jgi:hypothetical protein